MTPGIAPMLLWCADNWDILQMVRRVIDPVIVLLYFGTSLYQQVLLPLVVLTLVLVLVQSTWTMLTVLAVKVTSLTAHTAPLSAATMATQKMLE